MINSFMKVKRKIIRIEVLLINKSQESISKNRAYCTNELILISQKKPGILASGWLLYSLRDVLSSEKLAANFPRRLRHREFLFDLLRIAGN